MNISEYKTTTLARSDVFDIVGLEAVENMPNPDKTKGGYVQVVQTTESGKKITKYDAHLMREVDGLKKFEKEHFAVINEGETDEEVVFTAPTTEKQEVSETEIETYVNSLPFKSIKITEIDTEAPSATFTAIKVEGGVGKRVEVFAYREGKGAPTYVEITK